MSSVNKTRRFTQLALFVSMAMVLSYMERFIPILPSFPGVKLGLANIITLMVLLMYSWKEALIVLVARVTLLSFFTGSGVSFLYSMSGGLLSLLGMKLALRYTSRVFSLMGVSVIGAFLHNTAQMLVLAAILGSFTVAVYYYPVLILAAVATGSLTGFIALHLHRHLLRLGKV
jgi:heptaprenyl diphosphate synthase